MTALQDWLSISPVTSKTFRSLLCGGPLRDLLTSKRVADRYNAPLLRPGVERC